MIFLCLECLLYPLLPVGNPFHGVQVGLTPHFILSIRGKACHPGLSLQRSSPPGHRVSFREEHRTQTGQSDLSSGAIEKDFFPAGPNWEDRSVGVR